jgi:hypothetical protein
MTMLDVSIGAGSGVSFADTYWSTSEPVAPDTSRRDATNLGLALVNWMILLFLMCTMLLAATLPNDSAVMGGVASVTCSGKTCAPAQPAH